MLVLEKTASTAMARTPFLEYRNLIVENLGENEVQILTTYHDLSGKMIAEGAVWDKVDPKGMLIYESLQPRIKKRLFGLIKQEVFDIGFIHFKTESGTSKIRLTAYNGHIGKVRGRILLGSTTKDTSDVETVAHATETSLVKVEGRGRMLRLQVFAESRGNDVRIHIYVDGTHVDMFTNNAYDLNVLTEKPHCVIDDPANSRTHFIINIPYPFQSSIEVKAFQGTGGNVDYQVPRLLCEVESEL